PDHGLPAVRPSRPLRRRRQRFLAGRGARMRVRVWGCRGSLAAPGPATVRYGGNTSCLEVELEEGRLIFDAGPGIRLLGERLCEMGADRRPIHILLSHLHLDHLQGLAFFAPLWRPECELHVWGPQSPTQSLEERVAT